MKLRRLSFFYSLYFRFLPIPVKARFSNIICAVKRNFPLSNHYFNHCSRFSVDQSKITVMSRDLCSMKRVNALSLCKSRWDFIATTVGC